MSSVSVAPFGRTRDGRDVDVYTLTNSAGLEARVMNFGGVVLSLSVPDRNGELGDIVLGHDTLSEYEQARVFFGALIGRYANRIAKGRFTLDGIAYQLATNNGDNHLHGGNVGFDRVVWNAQPIDGEAALRLSYTSPAGDEGYPGELSVAVIYMTNDSSELTIDYSARTDAPTIVNLTNHSYFNLAGHGSPTVLDHILTINAGRFTPVDATAIPTGELRDVAGTPFDMRDPRAIGEMIDSRDEQLAVGGGYDHNWVLEDGEGLKRAATVYHAASGRRMEVFTTEPGIQFYSGNFLDGGLRGKSGAGYPRRSAFCLETQHFPDSPNRPEFPSTVLRPGGVYRSRTVYRFSADGA